MEGNYLVGDVMPKKDYMEYELCSQQVLFIDSLHSRRFLLEVCFQRWNCEGNEV